MEINLGKFNAWQPIGDDNKSIGLNEMDLRPKKSRRRVMLTMARRTSEEVPKLPRLTREDSFTPHEKLQIHYFFCSFHSKCSWDPNLHNKFTPSTSPTHSTSRSPIPFDFPFLHQSWLASRGWTDPPPSRWLPTLLTWQPEPWREPWIYPLALPPVSRSSSSIFSQTIAICRWLGRSRARSDSIDSRGEETDLDPMSSPSVSLPAASAMET